MRLMLTALLVLFLFQHRRQQALFRRFFVNEMALKISIAVKVTNATRMPRSFYTNESHLMTHNLNELCN